MKILVIEDDQKHINDACIYSSALVGCRVDFATTLKEAILLLEKNNYDGVISDVFFPAEIGASAETYENAILINIKLFEMGIHHVFNTAGNHHGSKFNGFLWKTPKEIYPEDSYHFLNTGMIIEAYPRNQEDEKSEKQWESAFKYILLAHTFLQLPDKGEEIIKASNLHGFPFGDYGKLTWSLRECSHPFISEIFRKYNAK